MATTFSVKRNPPPNDDHVQAVRAESVPTPRYPGLYGWEVAYQMPNGAVVFYSCFRKAWERYFVHLREELASGFLRTHREAIKGKRLLDLAFSRFARHIHPETLKAFFPTATVSTHPQQVIDGKEFIFGNRGWR